MANNNKDEEQRVVGRLLTCHPVTITLGGSARVAEDATVYEVSGGGRVRSWMPAETPELASPSASQGRSRIRRRSLQQSDGQIFNIFNNSDSDAGDSGTDYDDNGDDVDGGDVVGYFEDLSLCRFAAAQARKLVVEEEGEAEMVSHSDAVALQKDFLWSDDLTSFTGQRESYGRDPGPTFSSSDPATIFQKIWDREFMEQVAKKTNKYAWRTISQLSDPDFGTGIPSYLDSWTEVTADELYIFFALYILMSICQRAKIHEYWDTGSLGMPAFRRLMSRSRFQQVNKFLHFDDNENLLTSVHDRKVEKIAPVLDHCNKKFAELYIPSQFLSLDESLLLWKGSLSWKQCIRSKDVRFEIKSFELCEAETGYLLQYRLYTGKMSDMHSDTLHGFQDNTAKVVLDLMEGYLDAGHVLVMDNWYHQLPLTRYLKSRHTDVLGTISRRRVGIPQAIKDLNPNRMERGTTVSRHSGDIALVAWNDVKVVTVMSTYHHHEMVLRKRAGQKRKIPVAMCDYKKYMGCVALKDQKLSKFLIERKRSQKWYMKVFRRLLNYSLLNAYIIYTRNPMYKLLSHNLFRRKVAMDLLSRFPRAYSMPSEVSNITHEQRLLPGKHYPIHTETSASGSRKKQMQCVRCLALNKRRSVTTMCQLCKAPLCLGQCWAEYHDV